LSTINQVADGLQTTIENVSNLRVYSELEDIVNPPACVITFQGIEYDTAMARGLDTMTFELLVIVQRSNVRTAVDKLEKYITGSGSESIKAKIFASPGLGLSDTNARAINVSSVENMTVNGIDCLSASIVVTVYTKGN
tara:strand:+ start:199 stop:612 length:414 start_codon:yes stop_codon:yes gene_type:complete